MLLIFLMFTACDFHCGAIYPEKQTYLILKMVHGNCYTVSSLKLEFSTSDFFKVILESLGISKY